MFDKITAIIKTFERSNKLYSLLDSIKEYYPKMKVVIVDDSKEEKQIIQENVKYFKVPFDTGLSAGRNFAINNIDTEYFLLLDDDFLFNEETKIETFYNILENTNIDIIGGDVKYLNGRMMQYDGILYLDNKRILHCKKDYYEIKDNYKTCDIVLNFFLARTKKIKEVGGWDERLKLAEHTAFFWNHKGKIKVAYTNKVLILHDPERTGDYINYRNRARSFFDEYMVRENIRGIMNCNGALNKSSLYDGSLFKKIDTIKENKSIEIKNNKELNSIINIKPKKYKVVSNIVDNCNRTLGYWLRNVDIKDRKYLLRLIDEKGWNISKKVSWVEIKVLLNNMNL
jgi:glycosyltransferase involved in cell wall biosynthesis